MKKISFSAFAALCFLLALSSCERQSAQLNQAAGILTGDQEITPRTEDCDDCPDDYCCCTLELRLPQSTADVHLCGISKGTQFCGPYTPPDSCPQFSGIGYLATLIYNDPPLYVCMQENGVIRLYNPSLAMITVRITCQAGAMNPQFVNITIPGLGEVFYSTNEFCELEECHD